LDISAQYTGIGGCITENTAKIYFSSHLIGNCPNRLQLIIYLPVTGVLCIGAEIQSQEQEECQSLTPAINTREKAGQIITWYVYISEIHY
jgi:hypothetical protein